ncbi:hypothetical protein SRB5_22850 [Streptomyces sp. RB5]|uniref:HTH luxR-type domain-containing protein n=1 Tax=Streptomyces smaragdinus TaxID=2585196 RepID=A0A7K0CFA6_9ACTN|nr:AAA family ATPase [Streptomyces smaragdinus]MQY12155.1 hypothetical protein [Streptomyces smaragdinus]
MTSPAPELSTGLDAESVLDGMLKGMETSRTSPVFVGRADELRILGEALTEAGRGEPRAVLVGGEAGVGKTRLLAEFLTAAAADGAVTVLGGCVETGAEGLPFHPVATALRGLRRRLGPELAEAAAGQEGELARLLPELGEPTAAVSDTDGRARLFELTVRLLEGLAQGRTLVLALEDLHWADRSTRELLSYLLRSARDSRLLVVATYRSDDLHRRHPLRPALAEYERLRSVRRFELPRFDRAEVRSQIAAFTGEQPADQLLDRVFERSGGNAFFVEELARSLGDGLPSGISDSLRDLLLVRIEGLPEPVQRVVRIAAQGGGAVEFRLLATVSGLGEDELIDTLRTAVGASVLQPCDDECFCFRHALMREAVADDLLPGERTRLSRRYAEALEADPALVRAEEFAARLAGYWYHAHDPAKALPAVISAAAASRGRHAYAEQLALLERALELWDDTPEDIRTAALRRGVDEGLCRPISTEHRGDFADLLAAVAVAARHAGERERALALGKRALRLLEGDPSPAAGARPAAADPIRAAWFWSERYQLMRELSRSDGWAEIARAQELVKGLPPSPVHAEVLADAAHWGALHQPGPGALESARQAVELARMTGARDTELAATVTLGWLTLDAGGVDEGLDLVREVAATEIAPGTLSTVVRSHGNVADMLLGIGRFTESVRAGEEGVALAQWHGLPEVAAWIGGNLGEALMALGRWDEADRALRLAHDRRGISARTRGQIEGHLADLALARGDFAGARRLLEAAAASFGDVYPEPQHTLPCARTAIGIAAADGRILDARTLAEEAVGDGIAPGLQRYGWPLLYAAAAAEARARGLPVAELGRPAAVDRLRKAMRRLPQFVPLWAGLALMTEAELRTATGQDAVARWEEAVAAVQPLGYPELLVTARLRLAEALVTEGAADARGRAGELLRPAESGAASLGAGPLRTRVAQLAGRARIPLQETAAAPPAPADALGLTARELDVLRLVAAGRSNRQIAEELFISPKTASVHVSNILAKLGASGRGEAAALAHRLGVFDPPRVS